MNYLFFLICSTIGGEDTDKGAVPLAGLEFDNTISQGIKGVILADADVTSGMEFGASLANDDVTRSGYLATKKLHSKSFAFTVPAIITTADAFLMCHFIGLLDLLMNLNSNAVNSDLGKLLAVAFFYLIAFASLLLEDDHFVTLDMSDHAGRNRCIA